MDSSQILVKTGKGVEELKHRSLPQTVRALLIMVDGSTSIGNLLLKTGQIPKAEDDLIWLIREGYIQSLPPGQQIKGAAPAGPGAATAQQVSSKQALIAMSRELLGGDATKVIQRLEEVQDSRAELLAAVERCHKFIKLTIDEVKAHQFLKAGHALLAEMR
jgi:hypothetical protein